MNILIFLMLFPLMAHALTEEEQKDLIEENKFLKAELLKSKETPKD